MKKTTMKDIAIKAKVSKTTVSMVINNRADNISEGTKERILNIAKKLNYIPNSVARTLSTNKSKTIGIILPDIMNPFFSQIARAVEDTANNLGYNVIFCNTDNKENKEEKYTKLLISKLVDGVIFIAGGKSNKSVDILKSNNVFFVVVDRYIKMDKEIYGIFSINKEGAIRGTEYLLSKGRKNIVFVEGPEELETAKERFYGYKEVMIKNNLYKKEMVFKSDFSIEGGMKVTEDILEKVPTVEAIFYSNDIMAYGGLKLLTRRGIKIPEEIAVMGFDNIDIAKYFEPELTTISQPIYKMGKEACRLLINLIEGVEIKKKQIYFDTTLVVRSTT